MENLETPNPNNNDTNVSDSSFEETIRELDEAEFPVSNADEIRRLNGEIRRLNSAQATLNSAQARLNAARASLRAEVTEARGRMMNIAGFHEFLSPRTALQMLWNAEEEEEALAPVPVVDLTSAFEEAEI
mmetsp:Transcript_10135/g.24203  ORF Transcript_10135/g.24203 Transcript_10135/m.24203 type:complete len:130 (-) Transcript_10135:2149-2538(-)